VGAAKQRFDSSNSFRFYFGDVRNMHLIASSDEWKDEASISSTTASRDACRPR
jgi:hypothetical protein